MKFDGSTARGFGCENSKIFTETGIKSGFGGQKRGKNAGLQLLISNCAKTHLIANNNVTCIGEAVNWPSQAWGGGCETFFLGLWLKTQGGKDGNWMHAGFTLQRYCSPPGYNSLQKKLPWERKLGKLSSELATAAR
jgi:hypothetical protein